jgi:hypothetical protein
MKGSVPFYKEYHVYFQIGSYSCPGPVLRETEKVSFIFEVGDIFEDTVTRKPIGDIVALQKGYYYTEVIVKIL